MTFGETIRAERLQRGMSQDRFAAATGLHRTHIHLIEKGRRHPRLDTLVKLARGLEVSPAELLDSCPIDFGGAIIVVPMEDQAGLLRWASGVLKRCRKLLMRRSLMSWKPSFSLLDSRFIRRAAYAVIALAHVLPGATNALAAAPTSSCPASYVAETAAAATLQACGDTSYPLSSVTPTAGGGQSYNYEGDGIGASYTVPPPAFDPANASAAELKEYGIPTAPPTSSPEYSMWNKMINNMHFNGAPPSHLVFLHNATGFRSADPSTQESTEAGGQASANWSGYGDFASTQAYNMSTTYLVDHS